MKYALVIFDFDGTLCSSRLDGLQSIKMAYQTVGEVIPSDEVMNKAVNQGAPGYELIKLLSPEINEVYQQKLLLEYQRINSQAGHEKAFLFPGVIQLLDQLKSEGIPRVIVSNKYSQELEQAIKKFNLSNYITKSVGITFDSFVKPDFQVFERYIKPHFPNILPSEILVVGDTITDLMFAKNIQADACWVSYGDGDPIVCKALSPQYIVDSLDELNDILFPPLMVSRSIAS